MTTHLDTQTEPGARAGVIKLGLDVHASSIVVVRQIDAQGAQPAQHFTPEAFLGFAQRQTRLAAAVHSCYEAGPFGYVLHRRLTALGLTNLVVRPRDWSTYGERVKTDSRDAAALCSCLDRHLAGNRGALAVVRVPTEAEEARRAVSRQRQSLQRERVRLILQGKSAGLLRGHPLAKDWWEEKVLPRLALPLDLHAHLERWQRVRLSINVELQALTEQLQQAAPAGLPLGLGPITWELLTREVGDWHRFRNRRQVASYTGLCPSEHSSGQSRAQGCITRHGNPRLRHLLIEAVWRLLTFQPQYRAIAKWHAGAHRPAPDRRPEEEDHRRHRPTTRGGPVASGHRSHHRRPPRTTNQLTLERRVVRHVPWVCCVTPVLKDGAARHSFAPTLNRS